MQKNSKKGIFSNVGYWVVIGLGLWAQNAMADVTYEQISTSKTKPGYADAYTHKAIAQCSTGRILIGVLSHNTLSAQHESNFNFSTQNGAVCTDHADAYTRMQPLKDGSNNLIGFEVWYGGYYSNTATCNISGVFICAKVCN